MGGGCQDGFGMRGILEREFGPSAPALRLLSSLLRDSKLRRNVSVLHFQVHTTSNISGYDRQEENIQRSILQPLFLEINTPKSICTYLHEVHRSSQAFNIS